MEQKKGNNSKLKGYLEIEGQAPIEFQVKEGVEIPYSKSVFGLADYIVLAVREGFEVKFNKDQDTGNLVLTVGNKAVHLPNDHENEKKFMKYIEYLKEQNDV